MYLCPTKTIYKTGGKWNLACGHSSLAPGQDDPLSWEENFNIKTDSFILSHFLTFLFYEYVS